MNTDNIVFTARRSHSDKCDYFPCDTFGLQTFNTYDREYGYGEPGWMSERFCFCRGLLTEKYPDGSPASTWFALMPWASASIIEGLAF